MQDTANGEGQASYKPKFLAALLGGWLLASGFYAWYSGAQHSETLAGAVAGALGYTAVPLVVGYFLLRKAISPTSLRNRGLVTVLLLIAMVGKGISDDTAKLKASIRSDCEAKLANSDPTARNAYCTCFSNGATSIVQKSSRQAMLNQSPLEPIDDQFFVQAMTDMAALCMK